MIPSRAAWFVSLVLIASPAFSIAEPAEDAYQKAMRLGTEAYAAKDFEKADERFRSAEVIASSTFVEDIRLVQALDWRVRTLWAFGRFDEALPLAEKELAIVEKLPKAQPLEIAQSLGSLATTELSLGRDDRAESLYRRALPLYAIENGNPSKDHPWANMALHNLGAIADKKERFAEAEGFYRRALACQDNWPNPNLADLAENLGGLGRVILEQERYDEARPFLIRVLDVYQKLGPETRRTAEVLGALGTIEAETGHYRESEAFLNRALVVFEKSADADPSDLAECHHLLAVALVKQGRHAEAEAQARRAIELAKAVGDSMRDSLPGYETALAGVFSMQGKYAEALPLMRHALESEERRVGRDSPELTSYLGNLGMALFTLGRAEEADAILSRALAIVEKAPNPPADLGGLLNNAALVAFERGRYGEARERTRKALAFEEKAKGPDHPDLIRLLTNMSRSLQSDGRPALAEPYSLRALAIAEKSLGSDHPETGLCLLQLAQVLKERRATAEVDALFQRALAIEEKSVGQSHLNYIAVLSELSSFQADSCRPRDALEPAERALASLEATLGPEHPEVISALAHLGYIQLSVSRGLAADRTAARVLELRCKVAPANQRGMSATYELLGMIAFERSDLDQALTLTEQAFAIKSSIYGPDHPVVAGLLTRLSSIELERGNLAKAGELAARAVAIRDKVEDRPLDLAQSLDALGNAERTLGHLAEAESLLKRAQTIRRQSPGADDLDLASSLANLAYLECDRGRFAEAESLLDQALATIERLYGANDIRLDGLLHQRAKLFRKTNRIAKADEAESRAKQILEAFRRAD